MAVVSPSIFEVKIMYKANAQQCMNVLHYITQGSLAGAEASDISLSFITGFATSGPDSVLDAMIQLMSANVHISRLTGQFVWPTRWRMQSIDVDIPGLVAEVLQAQNLAGVIEKFGDQGNRHNVGSFHLGGIPASRFSLGDLTPAAKADLEEVAETLLIERTDGTTAAAYIPCILNKEKIPDSNPPRYQIIGASQIVGTTAMPEARVMRRRTKGLGI